jgi:hypothetical protein
VYLVVLVVVVFRNDRSIVVVVSGGSTVVGAAGVLLGSPPASVEFRCTAGAARYNKIKTTITSNAFLRVIVSPFYHVDEVDGPPHK